MAADSDECLACALTAGTRELPGGLIHATAHWRVEHCVGPLGIGTLIVKPIRHVTQVADLDDEEADELGPLLRRTTEPTASYHAAMNTSVREQLHDWIDVLDEARAAALLAELESEYADDREFPPLTEEELERLDRSIEQADAGMVMSIDEVRRRLALRK